MITAEGSVFSSFAISQRRSAMWFLRTYATGLDFTASAQSYFNPLFWFASPPPTRQTFLNLLDNQDAWLNRIASGEDRRSDALVRWDNAFLIILDGLEKVYQGATADVLRNVGITTWETAVTAAKLPGTAAREVGQIAEVFSSLAARIQENPVRFLVQVAAIGGAIALTPLLFKGVAAKQIHRGRRG